MASPVLHIKDAYFFEVPKFLWPSDRRAKADFPDVWIRLDPDFQLWEAQRLQEALAKVSSTTPAWSELQQTYLAWKAQPDNFGKPLSGMLDEAYTSDRKKWEAENTAEKKADKNYADKPFSAWLDANPTDHPWFDWQMSEPGFQETWGSVKREAEGVAKYLADPQVKGWSEETVAGYNQALRGKILIPQPFGQLRNLHEPHSGLCISKFMIIEVVVALVLVAVFSWLGKKAAAGGAPRGRLWNLLEVFLVYLRDKVARPAIGEHDGDRFVPLLWTIFMFILCCNLCGMLPWVGAPTSSFGVTTGLAAVTFATGLGCGVRKFGPLGYLLNQIPHIDLVFPFGLVIKVGILLIELLSLCIKHVVLAIRLLANMFAGHLVLLGIMGLAFGASAAISFIGAPNWQWWVTAAVAVVASTLFSCLELFVAFLQAYVFTFLSALFIGAAIHHH
ncbi:MAG: F0F1 ATP synthase subunit A [Planctomycetota bacterium]|nr:F0F1 ATP synthase subunit A [Planctomycetota bacterium]